MKRTSLLLFQIFLIFTSLSCLIAGQSSQTESEINSPDQFPSEFELWEAGKLPNIQLYSGRESINNYREAYHIQITGQDDSGASINGFQEYLREIDKTRDASRETQSIQMPNKYLSGFHEYAQYEGFDYFVHDALPGGRVCEKNEIPEDTSHYSDVRVIQTLQSITPGKKLEENVDVNGFLANVYEIEDLGLLLARELLQVNGKVWIAQQPAFFLKAEGTADGVLEFGNTLYTGNVTFSYEMKDFDQVQVQLPVLCAHPPEDYIPLPPNAEDLVDFSGLLTFYSPDPLEQVVSYYLEELDSGGWQVEKPSKNAFEQVIQAQILTPEGVQITAEIKFIKMGDGRSSVKLSWQAH